MAWTKSETKRNHLLLVDGLILRVQGAMQLGMGMVGVAGAVGGLERGGFRVQGTGGSGFGLLIRRSFIRKESGVILNVILAHVIFIHDFIILIRQQTN